MNNSARSRFVGIVEHSLVFAGDMLPYGVVLLLTIVVGYSLGLKDAADLSLAYAYVALVTALVCGPNLLSLRRRMPLADSRVAVVFAGLLLRTVVIAAGAAMILVYMPLTEAGDRPEFIRLIAYLFWGRLFETAIDAPAISTQYAQGPRAYFFLRAVVFLVIFGVTGVGLLTVGDRGVDWIILWYALGCVVGLLVAFKLFYCSLDSMKGFLLEIREQTTEFGRFFLATALFLIASRVHPLVIEQLSGVEVAGKFALVQTLFSVLGLAATGVAGVFFWSWNRQGGLRYRFSVPWRSMVNGAIGGLMMGIVGALAMDFLFLRPLGSSLELRQAAWILCMATPLLLVQAMLSNLLVLHRRDSEMLRLSALNAIASMILIVFFVDIFGVIGAALSIVGAVSMSVMLGVVFVRRANA